MRAIVWATALAATSAFGTAVAAEQGHATLPRPHGHPCLLVTKEQVAAIKQKAVQFDWAKTAYDAVIKEAGGWLTRTIQVPSRGGQWWHYYACPKDGTRLTTLSPTRHECPTCKQVYTGEPYDTVVISADHSRLARAAETLGLAFQFTGDARYAAKAAEILEAYAARYLTYPRHTIRNEDRVGGGRVGPQTLDESTWLIPIVQGYDLIWETLAAEPRERIETRLLRPAAQLILDHRMGIHNIQCWKNSAVGLVGICLDDPRFLADAFDSPHGIREQLAKGILDDGSWYEGAWGYHYYTMSALSPLAEAARHVGIDLYGERYRRLYEAPLDLALPNGRLPAFNDSGEADAYAQWPRYELAYARWRNPLFAAMLVNRQRTTRESLLYGVPELGAPAPLPTGSRCFPVSGYAYLQCGTGVDAPVAILDFAPHGGGHGHPEKLQLLLYALGQILAPDPGSIAYGVRLHGEWYRQTIAHNTVTVDRQSQKPCQGKLLFFHATQELAVACATADDAYPGIRFARTVAMLPGGLVADVVELAGNKPHTYDWAFHAYGELTDVDPPLGAAPDAPGQTNGYQHIREPRSAATAPASSTTGTDTRRIRATWAGKTASVALAALADCATRIYAGDGYGQPPARKLPTLIIRNEGTQATLATAFCVAREKPPAFRAFAHTADGRLRLDIEKGPERAIVLLPLAVNQGVRLVAEADPPTLPCESDARVAAAWFGKSGTALAFFDGTRLRAGDLAVTSSGRGSLSIGPAENHQASLTLDAPNEVTVTITGLFGAGYRVRSADGAAVPSSGRENSLTFQAKPGRYVIFLP